MGTRELGRHAEAVDSYDKGLAINPDDASAWFIRGAELGILGLHTEALASFDKAIAINPEDAYAWNFRESRSMNSESIQKRSTLMTRRLPSNLITLR